MGQDSMDMTTTRQKRQYMAIQSIKHKELLRALKWAIATYPKTRSRSVEPHLLRWRLSKFMELLTHHNVMPIAKFNGNSFSLMAPDHALGDSGRRHRGGENGQLAGNVNRGGQ